MISVWAFVKANWKPLALLILAALAWWLLDRYGDRRYAQGRQDVISDDAKATQALRDDVAKLTAEKAALAAAAKAHHDDEHAQTVIAAAAPVGTRELCKPAPDDRSRRVPETSHAHSGDATSSAASAMVQQMPTPDHGQLDDRSRLLGALAALADEQSAVIREFQAR